MLNKNEINISDSDKRELRGNFDIFLKIFKYPMRYCLLIYYSLQAGNTELQFEKTMLEELGFRSCSYCYPR